MRDESVGGGVEISVEILRDRGGDARGARRGGTS